MTGIYTVKQAAQRLGVSPKTVNRWINEGWFPGAYKLNPNAKNSPYRIPESDVEIFEEKRYRSPAAT